METIGLATEAYLATSLENSEGQAQDETNSRQIKDSTLGESATSSTVNQEGHAKHSLLLPKVEGLEDRWRRTPPTQSKLTKLFVF